MLAAGAASSGAEKESEGKHQQDAYDCFHRKLPPHCKDPRQKKPSPEYGYFFSPGTSGRGPRPEMASLIRLSAWMFCMLK